ncbi:MAG: hypothetical protein JWM11_7155 [Planctomycetaceae bacterium]|nr:hypothetical protein [Planctomycetaceae bacterium]
MTNSASPPSSYIIQGGIEGRERLRLLARVMRPTTMSLFERIGLRSGMSCLDMGCGGGDVAFELARLVGVNGRVLGFDIDEPKLEIARSEAETYGLRNITFQQSEVMDCELKPEFDVVYARFLLTHLQDPAGALARIHQAVAPGGILVVEDIDFTGHFCSPSSTAFSRYVELYTQAAQRRGADPNIGPRLPGMLMDVGCQRVQMHVVQPATYDGEAKLISAITMEKIADAVLAAQLASPSEVEQIISELYQFARDPRTVMSIPRIVQTWGYRAASSADLRAGGESR